MRTVYPTCLFLSNYAVSVCFSCQKAALIVKKRKAAAETTALRWILYHSFSGNLKGTVPVILNQYHGFFDKHKSILLL